MAGCKPEYLPWVLTAVEAACTDEFNIHGILATTMPVGPVMICSGPEGDRDELAGSALGQGNRANSTIGRALQLVIRNVGGGVPARSTVPRTAIPARSASASPRTISSRRSAPSPSSTASSPGGALTLFPGEGPRCRRSTLPRTRLARPFPRHLPPVDASSQARARVRRDPGDGARTRSRVRRRQVGRDGILAGIGRRSSPARLRNS